MQINVMDKSNFKESTSSKVVTITPDDKLLNCLATVYDINEIFYTKLGHTIEPENLMVIKFGSLSSKCTSLISYGL